MRVRRETLADMLRSHGEHGLAERALSVTDDELRGIRERGAHYALSEHAPACGYSMGGARALSLAAIDVLEGTPRDLRWTRTNGERERGGPTSLTVPSSPATARCDKLSSSSSLR